VMWQRLRAGRSPFSADRNHLHHKLLGLGFAHAEAVAVIYLLQVALFLVAYFLRFESDLTILAVFAAFAAAALGALRWAEGSGWRAHSGQALPLISWFIGWLRRASATVLPTATMWIIGIGIAVYATAAVAGAGRISLDLGI